MAKSRAEIQRAYRERKKGKDKDFLKKETRRVLKYYTPSSKLSKEELAKRRGRWRENKRKHRELKKAEKGVEDSALKVKISANTSKNRRRIREKSQKIRRLEERIKSLEKANKKITKRNERLTKKIKSPKDIPIPEMSPHSRTNAQIESSGMRVKQVPLKLKKRILFSNVLVDEIKDSLKKNRSTVGTRAIRNVISGKVVKKYRVLQQLSKEVGVSRKFVRAAKTKNVVGAKRKSRLLELREKVRNNVVKFLERDDNSRILAGKNDTKKCGKQRVQKRILSDYLYNLRIKYLAEFPNDRMISQAVFYKMRPAYMMLASFASRDTCMCQQHQNMALLLRSMKSQKMTSTGNPEMFIKDNSDEQVKDTFSKIKDNDYITYEQWKRVQEDGKKRMKLLSFKASKKDFLEKVTGSISKFREHVRRHHEQYLQLRRLKNDLPVGHIIVQMDFAENYNCQSCEGVQSAQWNSPTMVSLHPVVVYYKKPNEDKLKQKSFVLVSEELSHDASAVYTIMKALHEQLQHLVPNLAYVHYWTDGPTSQYRNKTIFSIVANHTEEFGMPARWNYFEAGHGKGPCDGVGVAVKRMADEAVRSGKVKIEDAQGFFAWATKSENTNSVKYLFYTKDDFKRAAAALEKYSTTQPVPGTMNVHAVGAVASHTVITRTTSCYCPACLANPKKSNCVWKAALLRRPSTSSVLSELSVKVDDFVAAAYDGDWYVGKVQEVDIIDGEVQVTFMRRAGNPHDYTVRWPAREDVIWVPKASVLCVIEPPTQSSKTRKTYSLSSATVKLVERQFRLL